MSEQWKVQTWIDEVAFSRQGVRRIARVDKGRLTATHEHFLRAGPPALRQRNWQGWQVRVPQEYRNKPGLLPEGIRWLEIRSPNGKPVILEFYRGWGQLDLARAYEAAQSSEGAEDEQDGQQSHGTLPFRSQSGQGAGQPEDRHQKEVR